MIYRHVCSVGTNCLAASFLRKLSLKVCSYPFDWVYSTPAIVRDCISNDFSTYLDRSCYTDHSLNVNRGASHTLYTKDMFNHHNPRTENDYNYFIRCVERFRNLCKNNEPKLFIMMIDTQVHDKDALYTDIRLLNAELSRVTQNYRFAVIFFKQTNSGPSSTHMIEGDLHIFDLSVLSKSTGVQFEDERDNKYIKTLLKDKFQFDIVGTRQTVYFV